MAPAGRELSRSHGSRGSALAAHAGPETSQSTGLYDPSFEHDACGVAFIADLTGKPGHDVVSKALTALCNLEHRGAQGGDPGTGDGAGILTQIPDVFFRGGQEGQADRVVPRGRGPGRGRPRGG